MIRRKRGFLALCLSLFFAAATSGAPIVGVYYYPWWGENIGGHTFNKTLRAHTTPNDQLPAIGAYSSRSLNVISQHIDQSHLGNISMWSMSWWGPHRFEDITIRNHILTHPRASELNYTVHYESAGRLGDFDNPNYSKLIPDFRHLADNIFSDPNYMRIDDRPVVVMYLSRVFFDDAAGAAALSNLRTTMQQEYGYDPYIIGDHLFNAVAAGASNLDAITSFDVYGQVFGSGVVDQSRIDRLAQIYANAQNVADDAGVEFVPGLSPGYNDKAVRSGHLPAARYLSGGDFGSVMEAMLEDAVLPHTDQDIDELILVNSFNEWHEDTQIEASLLGPATNTDDSPSGSELTEGRFYEGYGNRYLEILRHATQPPTPAEIRWGRGTAAGQLVGDYSDLANWNADDVQPDAPRIPGPGDRARVDHSGAQMTIGTTVHAKEFLFGVDEPGQAFLFEPASDVTLETNYFAAFNEGDVAVDIQAGASIVVGGNFLLGQYDGSQNGNQKMDDHDITVTVGGFVDVQGATILGDKYGLDGSGTPNGATTSEFVDVLLDVTTGTLRTKNLLFAPNGDLGVYLAANTSPGNENTMRVRLGNGGRIVITDADRTAEMNNLISSDLLFTDSVSGTIQVSFNGTDTLVQVVLAGDFDDDGEVDGADFMMWQRDSSSGSLADWQRHYGLATTAQAALVPEPATLMQTLAFACVGWTVRIRSRRRTQHARGR